MLKKPVLLLSCTKTHPFHALESTTSRHPTCLPQCRPYAMVSDGRSRHEHDRFPWPVVNAGSTVPTPYEIFGLQKGAPYSKRRFYELVKLYHPDRHDYRSSGDGLAYTTKLERYRLIVAANNLLSDPVKRGAYDRYGAGWNGRPEILGARDAYDQQGTWGGYSSRGWNDPHGPSQNATWEDWEKWYQRDAKGPQEPRFVSNGAFVCLVVLFAIVGGVAHAARAGHYSMRYSEHHDAVNETIHEELRRKRNETGTELSSRDERIHNFLRQRDQYAIAGPREERNRRLLSPPYASSSDDIN